MKIYFTHVMPAVLSLLLFVAIGSVAQPIPTPNYSKGYFDWPLNLTPGLVGNFGELRPNHYHMGLDCRTDQKQNQQVLAAAEGYIAKVKIEPSGFGRCIYINHPNGLTTLYAHLNSFNPELEKYITDEQYRLKSWRIFLDIPANLFPVTKGQFIAFSGTTGASQGPHLHFEVRDTKTDKVLNPLLFGFNIIDTVAPDIYKLAVYDRTISVFEQSPQMYAVKKVNGMYITVPSLIMSSSDRVSFAITSYDRYTSSTNRNGIFEAILYNDSLPIVGFQLDSISYDETRDLNAHIDYRMRINGGPFVQHVSRLPGYTNGPYKIINGDGVINISDDSAHKIKIEVSDPNGNTSILQFNVKHIPGAAKASMENQKKLYPNQPNEFTNNNFSVSLPPNCLYDTVSFNFSETVSKGASNIYSFLSPHIPEHGYFEVKIKADIAPESQERMMMQCFTNGKTEFSKAVNENGWYKARFRQFGSYQLITDLIPPTLAPIGFRDGMNVTKLNRLAFVAGDNTGEFKFSATIDGNWIRFTNDKGRIFSYIFDEHCPEGEHELKVSATDQVGNSTERIYHFTKTFAPPVVVKAKKNKAGKTIVSKGKVNKRKRKK